MTEQIKRTKIVKKSILTSGKGAPSDPTGGGGYKTGNMFGYKTGIVCGYKTRNNFVRE